MKQFLFLVSVVLSTYTTSLAQKAKYPTFENLLEYTSMTNDEFRIAIKDYGFSFERKTKVEDAVIFSYFRETNFNGFSVEYFSYLQNSNRSVTVLFSSYDDLEAMYLSPIKKNLVKYECAAESDDNEIRSCYLNNKFVCTITETHHKDLHKNSYRIGIESTSKDK